MYLRHNLISLDCSFCIKLVYLKTRGMVIEGVYQDINKKNEHYLERLTMTFYLLNACMQDHIILEIFRDMHLNQNSSCHFSQT